MTHVAKFCEEYLARFYPGREFTEARLHAQGGYVVFEVANNRLATQARIPDRQFSAITKEQFFRGVARILDDAFDLRSDTEKLPWQLYSAYV